MARHLSISNFRRYPPIQALAWCALAIILIEGLFGIFGPRSAMETNFKEIRQRVENEAAPTIQIIGDSVAAGGILPSIVCSDKNIVIRNDSIAGSGPAFSYLLLKKEIAAGNIPEILVIAHSPHTFAGTRFPVLTGRFAKVSELPALAWHSGNLFGVTFGIFTWFSYLLSYREEFKSLLKGDSSFFHQESVKSDTEQERIDKYYQLVRLGKF